MASSRPLGPSLLSGEGGAGIPSLVHQLPVHEDTFDPRLNAQRRAVEDDHVRVLTRFQAAQSVRDTEYLRGIERHGTQYFRFGQAISLGQRGVDEEPLSR